MRPPPVRKLRASLRNLRVWKVGLGVFVRIRFWWVERTEVGYWRARARQISEPYGGGVSMARLIRF